MNRTTLPTVAVLVVLCGGAIVVGLAVGSSGWRGDPVSALLRGDDVVAALRAPRVFLSAIIGASLAVAGVAMQVVLRNDLADPYVLGIAGGASAGAVLSLALFPGVPPGPAAAIGGATATSLVRGIARRGPYDPARLLLAGIAVGSVLASLTGLVLVLAPSERLLRSATFWLFGGVGTPPMGALVVPAAVFCAGFGWMWARAERLDRLSLGDDVATSLGTDTRALRRGLQLVAVVVTATVVAVGGLIGFVGLVAPHAARRLVGATHRRLLPVAALLGALVLIAADTVARSALSPREVPVGLVTAALGGPLFLWLLRRRPAWQ
jgi:iron complex transport system permease protein